MFVKRKPDAIIKVSTKKLELPVDILIKEIVEYAKENKIEFFKVKFELTDGCFEVANGIWTKEV